MTVVQSLGMLVEVGTSDWYPSVSYGSVTLYNQLSYDYATLYRTQPNVRTCVDFLARNIAQLGLHVFRRVSNTDRERLTDHPLALVLAEPLPAQFKVTRYRLIESLISDLGIYFNAYWLKVRPGGGSEPVGLLRIPPAYVRVTGGLVPTAYTIEFSDTRLQLRPEALVHVRGYNAENPLEGLSPLETLRRILAEEQAAGDYREYFWRNAARQGGVIMRPPTAPEWSPQARERFKSEFEQLYSGTENSGRTAILEEGMEWKAMTFTAQESEYLAGRKLTREECARAYHIPLPMVGILDHATFSNIKEQHRNLYQDCLGPWLRMIEEDIELQLLPEFEDTQGVYVEFNIAEKLGGSFEEQTEALQTAVGRPWMTADEARARMNMPSMGGDATRLVTPLNVLIGGQASPRDVPGQSSLKQLEIIRGVLGLDVGNVQRTSEGASHGVQWDLKAADVDPARLRVRVRHEEQWREALARTFRRQRESVTPRVADAVQVDELWDAVRWNRELGDDLYRLNTATALDWAQYVAEMMALDLSEAEMEAWLVEHSRVQAEYINGNTRDLLGNALTEEDRRGAVAGLFELLIGARAAQIAQSAVTTAANFGSQEAAKQSGLKTKTWQVNSSNPRPEHAAINGETVAIRERFSNGMLWPGDPAGGAENNANCMCSVRFGR
jgi:HK97 family phage portal protein